MSELNPYSLIYTFAHAPEEHTEQQPAGRVRPDNMIQSENHVTIT
jgi:hypothetical protein